MRGDGGEEEASRLSVIRARGKKEKGKKASGICGWIDRREGFCAGGGNARGRKQAPSLLIIEKEEGVALTSIGGN